MAATPTWGEPEFRDLCRAIWWFLNGDVAFFDANATTPHAAMQLITDRYAALGAVPTDLTQQEQTELRQVLSDAEAMLRAGPFGPEDPTVKQFLKDISAMWIDLGGYPGDIGS